MNILKKCILILLITALILSLCACGNEVQQATNDSATPQSRFDAAGNFIESAIDTSQMESSVQEYQESLEGETSLYRYWTYNGSEQDTIDMNVKLDGTTITLAETTVNDLKELGFELEFEIDTAPPMTAQGFTIRKDNKTCNAAAENNTDMTVDIADLPLSQFSGGFDEECLSYEYAGLKPNSSLNDVINTLGAPKSNITLTTNDYETIIDLNYINSTKEDGFNTVKTLDVYFKYDAGKNSAKLYGITVTYSHLPIETDATE